MTFLNTNLSFQSVVSSFSLGHGRISEYDAGLYRCDVKNLGEAAQIHRGTQVDIQVKVYCKYQASEKACTHLQEAEEEKKTVS